MTDLATSEEYDEWEAEKTMRDLRLGVRRVVEDLRLAKWQSLPFRVRAFELPKIVLQRVSAVREVVEAVLAAQNLQRALRASRGRSHKLYSNWRLS